MNDKIEIARRIVRLENGLKKLPKREHTVVVALSKLALRNLEKRLKAAEERHLNAVADERADGPFVPVPDDFFGADVGKEVVPYEDVPVDEFDRALDALPEPRAEMLPGLTEAELPDLREGDTLLVAASTGEIQIKDVGSSEWRVLNPPMTITRSPDEFRRDADETAAMIRSNPKPGTAPTSAERAANVLTANRWRNQFLPATERLTRQVRRQISRLFAKGRRVA